VCLIYLAGYQPGRAQQTKALLCRFLIRQPGFLHFEEPLLGVCLQFADNLLLRSRVQPQILPDVF
jgi:hypothetical protein